MVMKNNPCKLCCDRIVGCHSSCEKYISAKAKHDEARAELTKVKIGNWDIEDYTKRVKKKIAIRQRINR